MRSARCYALAPLVGALVALTMNAPARSQEGTQRQTKLVLPKVEAPDVKPELVVLPQMVHLRSPYQPTLDGACFSADGRTAATWSSGQLLVWDTAARQARRAIDGAWGTYTEWGHTFRRTGRAALSSDGTRVATCSLRLDFGRTPDVLVRVWDTRDGHLAWTAPLGPDDDRAHLGARSPTWRPDGTMLAAIVGLDYGLSPQELEARPQLPLRLLVWDAATGAQLAAVDLPADDSVPDSAVVVFRADGGVVVALRGVDKPSAGGYVRTDWAAAEPVSIVARSEWSPGFPLDVLAYRGSRPVASQDAKWMAFTWRETHEANWLGLWDATNQAPGRAVPLDEQRFAAERGRAQGPTGLVRVSGVRSLAGSLAALELEGVAAGTDATGTRTFDGDGELLDLATGRSTPLAAPAVLSADGELAAAGDQIVDIASGLHLFAVACPAPSGVRFEAGGHRLDWCDGAGRLARSWPVDGAVGVAAGGPGAGDRIVVGDSANVTVWESAAGLRVCSRADGGETLLPRGSTAFEEVTRLLASVPAPTIPSRFGGGAPRGWSCGLTALARRPDGTVTAAALVSDGMWNTEWTIALAEARPDGTVTMTSPVGWYDSTGLARDANRPPSPNVNHIALDRDGALLAWCASDEFVTAPSVAVWRVAGGGLLWQRDLLDTGSPRAITHEGRGTLWFSPDGTHLVLACVGGCTLTLDSNSGQTQGSIPANLVAAATSGLEWGVDCGGTDEGLSLVRTSDGARMLLDSDSSTTGSARTVGAEVSPDDRRLAVSYDTGVAHVWDLPPGGQAGADPMPVATFVHDLRTDAGACAVPAGYVWSTPGAERLLGWRLGDQIYPYEQFAERYERPDLVRKVLAGEDISEEKGLTGEMIPPTAVFLAPEYDAKVTGGRVKVEIEVAGVRPLKRVDLLLDGRPVSEDIVAAAKEETVEPNHVVMSLDLPMPTYARRVRLQAYAYDEEMLRSKAAEVTFTREGAKPPATVLQALSIGVTTYRNEAWNNLKYADADATSFATLAGEGAQRQVLVNGNATSSNVKFALAQMKQSVTEDDVAAIFLAGHGILGPNGDYYFLLHDSDEKDLANTALKWDDFVAALKALRAKLVLVFADTCHSGSLTGSESVNTLIDRLNKKAGVVVFTASRGDEASIEREDWGHGAFTKALLEGFGGAADTYPKDKQVSLAELRDYVIPRVEELTAGRQHPYLPRLEEFDPARPIASVLPGLG